jgi:hypothetical protein
LIIRLVNTKTAYPQKTAANRALIFRRNLS